LPGEFDLLCMKKVSENLRTYPNVGFIDEVDRKLAAARLFDGSDEGSSPGICKLSGF